MDILEKKVFIFNKLDMLCYQLLLKSLKKNEYIICTKSQKLLLQKHAKMYDISSGKFILDYEFVNKGYDFNCFTYISTNLKYLKYITKLHPSTNLILSKVPLKDTRGYLNDVTFDSTSYIIRKRNSNLQKTINRVLSYINPQETIYFFDNTLAHLKYDTNAIKRI